MDGGGGGDDQERGNERAEQGMPPPPPQDKWIEEETSMMRENQISPLPTSEDGGRRTDGRKRRGEAHAVANPKLRSLHRKMGGMGGSRGGTALFEEGRPTTAEQIRCWSVVWFWSCHSIWNIGWKIATVTRAKEEKRAKEGVSQSG